MMGRETSELKKVISDSEHRVTWQRLVGQGEVESSHLRGSGKDFLRRRHRKGTWRRGRDSDPSRENSHGEGPEMGEDPDISPAAKGAHVRRNTTPQGENPDAPSRHAFNKHFQRPSPETGAINAAGDKTDTTELDSVPAPEVLVI